ncbi:MAG: ATP-binding cassette domain-containing protein [Anaerolineae bacterium]|nr:ATP-binding cassette domain-containing protein [Anaerolineae bacterium]
MIQAQGLTKTYGDLVAIQDVTFEVQAGEILGFLGPNGAGKTTTMRIITGYMPPSAGSVRIAGHDVFTDSIEARRNIGYLPETVPLYPEMSVAGYLDFVGRLRHIPDRRERLAEVMERLHLEDRADTQIGKLSKGFRQRVGLAQAILHKPGVLVLDEPTIGLDPRQIIEVRDLIRELGGEHTIILSTHILPEVSQVCNRVLIINEGQIVAEDTPERLKERLKGGERIYLQVGGQHDGLVEALSDIAGVTEIEPKGDGAYEIVCALGTDRRADLARAVVTRGWPLLELRPVGMSLEEIFLKLTTE